MSEQTRSLLPIPASQQQQRPNDRDMPEPLANRRGAALQLDEFNLFVGRSLVFLGIVGNICEIGTSTMAMLIRLLDNPGTTNPGFWPKLGLSLFIALVFQAAMWTLVVNLNDSWISIFEGHPEKAFVTKGEVSLHLLFLVIFEFGGAAINGICDVVFFGNITSDPFIMSIGTAALVLSSILMWPLGWKIVRNARRRIRAAKARAIELANQAAAAARNTTRVSPVTVEGKLVRYGDANR
jgi:hypothetical protein